MKLRISLVVMLVAVLAISAVAADKCCGNKKICAEDANKCPVKKACKTEDCKKEAACAELKACVKGSCLVKVNGKEITEEEVMEVINPVIERQLQYMPEEQRETQKAAMVDRMKKQVIDSMIVQSLLDKEVADNNIVITDTQLDDEISNIAARQNMSAEDFQKVLAEQGRDFNDIKKQIKQGMGYDEYFEALVEKEVGKPTDEEIQKYYDENKQQFSQPEMVQSSHILFDTRTAPEGTDPNTYKTEQLAKAKEVLAEIKAGGDFAELAQKYSVCPSKSKGGDLGKNPRGRMVPEFDKATFEDIKPGTVGDEIVETQFGYHIIKVGEKTEAKTQSFDEAKDQIAEQLLNSKKQEFARKHIEKLKEDAKIEYPMDVKPADANAAK